MTLPLAVLNRPIPISGIGIYYSEGLGGDTRELPKPHGVVGSPEVLKRTQGMYDTVHLMVYCPDFIGDMNTINQTVLLLLQNLGWDPEDPRIGAVVHYTGSDEFIKVMTHSLIRHRIPYYSLTLPRHNDRALEAMDHGLKQCTHAVEFVSRRAAKGEYTTQSQFNVLAYAAGLSYLKFVLSE